LPDLGKVITVVSFQDDGKYEKKVPDAIGESLVSLQLMVRTNFHPVQRPTKPNLTFRGPCIVIYSYNKTNEMH